jgi:uncharacterized membrane protein
MPTNRLEALSDGVFSIAMTVLVLGIQVPDGGGEAELQAKLVLLWPKLASYALSFVMLGVLWVGHHYQFQYIRRTDRPLLWLNLLFLLAVTFLPFGTAVLGNYPGAPLAVLLYGATIVLGGASLLAHWTYASGRAHLVAADLDARVVALLKARIVSGMVVSGLAMGLAFVDTRASLAVFLGLPFVYLIGSRVDRHVGARAVLTRGEGDDESL